MVRDSQTDTREKKWLVCQTGVVAVRVIPQVDIRGGRVKCKGGAVSSNR